MKKNQGQLAAGADKIQSEDNMKKILAGLNEESQLESKKEGEDGPLKVNKESSSPGRAASLLKRGLRR